MTEQNIISLAWKLKRYRYPSLAKQRKKGHKGEVATKWYLKVKDGRELKTGQGEHFPGEIKMYF